MSIKLETNQSRECFRIWIENKPKITSIRKQIDISGSKSSISENETKKAKEGDESTVSLRKNFKLTNKGNHTMKLNSKKDEEMLNIVLFQKPENVQFNPHLKTIDKHNTLNYSTNKKEPKTKIEMVKSSENKGDISISSDVYGKDTNNSKITDYVENSRRISCEEDPGAIVPKIEISLNEWLSENKVQQPSQVRSHSARKHDIDSSIEKAKLVSNSQVNKFQVQTHSSSSKTKETPSKRKALFKTNNKLAPPPESPSLSIENEEEKKLKKTDNKSKNNTASSFNKKCKKVAKKSKNITDKHKNDIIKTITNKIRDSYMKNNLQGSYKNK